MFVGALVTASVGFVFTRLDGWLEPKEPPEVSIRCGTTREVDLGGSAYLNVVVVESQGGMIEEPRVDIELDNPLLVAFCNTEPEKRCEIKAKYGQGPESSLLYTDSRGFEAEQHLQILLVARQRNPEPISMSVKMSGYYYRSRDSKVLLSVTPKECEF